MKKKTKLENYMKKLKGQNRDQKSRENKRKKKNLKKKNCSVTSMDCIYDCCADETFDNRLNDVNGNSFQFDLMHSMYYLRLMEIDVRPSMK